MPTFPATLGALEAMIAVKAGERGRAVIDAPGGRPVAAYINHGRWVIDCPNCASGAIVHPEWATTVCGECFRRYIVIVPDDWETLEGLIWELPRHRQNWWPADHPRQPSSDSPEHVIMTAIVDGVRVRVPRGGV